MDQVNQLPELTRRQFEWVVKKVDALTPNPVQRATKIKDILALFAEQENITNWDLICFCEEYLTQQSLAEFQSLLWMCRELNKQVYQIHYQRTFEIGLIKEKVEGNG